MASSGVPGNWPPYMNTRDCSQGFCSFYCPQWCYIMFPPPPPSQFPQAKSPFHLSPIIIAIIGSLASAFLLVSYYTLLSKYCGRSGQATSTNHQHTGEFADPSSSHEPWQVSSAGLDEALIKSITVCKFKKGNGLIEGTCSVCLSEFNEDESIRLLPICSHAFHIPCIDTWLRSHSNCPLCRSSIIPIHASQLESFSLETESHLPRRDLVNSSANTTSVEIIDRNSGNIEGTLQNDAPSKTPSRGSARTELVGVQSSIRRLRAFSDLGSFERRDSVIDIKEEGCQNIGRSVSMDHSGQEHVSVADILRMNQDEDDEIVNCRLPAGSAGSSNKESEEGSKIGNRRSFSSGKLFFLSRERANNAIIPL